MNFFDISLIGQKFVINEDEHKVLLQMCITPLENTPNRILVLNSKTNNQNLKIVAWNERLKKILPIACVDAKQVIESVKKMPFDDVLRARVSALQVENLGSNESLHLEALSEGIEILIARNSEPVLSDTHQIEVEFDTTKLIPLHFVYGAFDGLRMCVYFELGGLIMSILEKSERIGRELKNTIEGQHALELYKMISQYPQETTFEFFQLINRYYITTM